MTEEKLAVKLAKVAERLDAGAPNTELPGADLIAYYLSPEERCERITDVKGHSVTVQRLPRCFSTAADYSASRGGADGGTGYTFDAGGLRPVPGGGSAGEWARQPACWPAGIG